MRIFLLIILVNLTACTSVASSTAALMVALHSQKIERDTRRYKGIDRCFVPNRPSPLEVGYRVFNDSSLVIEYQIILNPELKKTEDFAVKDVAYAYFYIAHKMGDSTAWQYLKLISPQLNEGAAKEIEEFIDYKYLQSHLTKCFNVPEIYKKRLKDRDLLKTQ